MNTPAVVTGIGVLSPVGADLEEHWSATLRGQNGIGPLTRFPAERYPAGLAGEVPGFDATALLPGRLVPQTDRVTQLSLVAAERAFADAAVNPADLDGFEMGVSTSSASGGFEFGQRELQHLWRHGPRHVSAYMSFAWFYAVNTGQISIRHGTNGPTGVFVGEQAGGLDAVSQARRSIRKGLRLMVTGGVDSALSPYAWACQLAGGGLSTRSDPARAYLPFDAEADGHVPGEGGAILLVEPDSPEVRARAPRVYGEIAGHGATFSPKPGSGRPPGLRRAAALALADARLEPADVDVVFADAAGRPGPDRAEAEAISSLFGPRGVPVTAPKSMTGRLYSGGAPLDLATALLSFRDQVIPPTVNVGRLAEGCDLDLVLDRPREAPLRTALVLARGHGGFNSAMVLRAAG
ncbi:ketosynthase chain-length factor [Streptomyces sp. NPDC048483]|uniref:ketosynthase chain-length factor n=1 Tax=Streptomyces sp. NPDC048483 TaxID=3154927 RepID=UPI003432668F